MCEFSTNNVYIHSREICESWDHEYGGFTVYQQDKHITVITKHTYRTLSNTSCLKDVGNHMMSVLSWQNAPLSGVSIVTFSSTVKASSASLHLLLLLFRVTSCFGNGLAMESSQLMIISPARSFLMVLCRCLGICQRQWFFQFQLGSDLGNHRWRQLDLIVARCGYTIW